MEVLGCGSARPILAVVTRALRDSPIGSGGRDQAPPPVRPASCVRSSSSRSRSRWTTAAGARSTKRASPSSCSRRSIPCRRCASRPRVRRRRALGTLQPGHAQAAGRCGRAGRGGLARSQLDRSRPRHRLQEAEGRVEPTVRRSVGRGHRQRDPLAGRHAGRGAQVAHAAHQLDQVGHLRVDGRIRFAGLRPAGADEQRLAIGERRIDGVQPAPDLLRHERQDRVQQAQGGGQRARRGPPDARALPVRSRPRGAARASPSPGTSRSSRSRRSRGQSAA